MRVRPALVASLALHAAVILGALIGLPFTRREAASGAPVPVTLVTDAPQAPAVPAPEPTPAAAEEPVPDASTEAPGEVEAPPEPTPPPPAPQPEPTPPRPAPTPRPQAAAPRPTPATPRPRRPAPPRQEPSLDLDALAESLPTQRPQRPRTQARLDLDSLSSSLDPRPRPGPRRSSAERGPPRPRAAPPGPSGANGSSEETALALGLIQERVTRNWNPNCNAPGAEQIRVRVSIELNRGGGLVGDPRSDVPLDDGSLRGVAAQRAVAAVRQAEPFDTLPPERYAEWRRIILNFNAREACR